MVVPLKPPAPQEWLVKMRRLIFALLAAVAALPAATFGTLYPLPAELSDLVLDEGRSVLYLSNFTAGRIEVFSSATRSFQAPIQLGINPSSVALSPDGQFLLILNFGSPSLFLLNLQTRELQTVAVPPSALTPKDLNAPRAAAFGADGAAYIITTNQFVRYDLATGSLTVLREGPVVLGVLPVPQPTQPAEILNARMAVSQDRNTIFVVGSVGQNAYFAFYYSVPDKKFTDRCASLVSSPVRFASMAPDGSRAMGGAVLLDRQVRVLADFTPTGALPIKTGPPPNTTIPTPPPPSPVTVVGATEFSRDGRTVYLSLLDPTDATAAPLLYVLDSDNLTVRQRILIPDQLTGKMVSDSSGSRLYALSSGGLTVLPIGNLASAPILSASTDTLAFRFNACNQRTATAGFDVLHQGPSGIPFSISSDMPGVHLSASGGTTPAHIDVTFDPAVLNNVKGTTSGLIRITANAAVNVFDAVRVLANWQDTDQRGTVFVQSGVLRDVLIDEPRGRFYILDSGRNRILVFDLNDFSLKATVRTGYFPVQMTLTRDQRQLLVANGQSETISVINLDSLQTDHLVFCPCSSYPRSVAVSTNATLAVSAVDRPHLVPTTDKTEVQLIVTEGRIDRFDVVSGTFIEPPTLGIFQNNISPKSLLAATPDGSAILIAEDTSTTGVGGVAKLYRADSDTFVVARAISSQPLKGGAATTDAGVYDAGAVILGPSLLPLGQFQDTPNEHNGLVFLGSQQIVRTLRPATGGGTGLVSRVDPVTLGLVRPVQLAEAPLTLPDDQPLRRSLVVTADGGKFITLSISGFEVIPGNFDSFVPPPVIQSVKNAADFSVPVAPGSLISIFGNNLASLSTSAGVLPLPTFLADTCLTVDHAPVPLLFLSPGQINAQLPFGAGAGSQMVLYAPGGVSASFSVSVSDAAPALYSSTFGGQARAAMPLVFRSFNQQPVTVSNPVHSGDVLYMFGNGFGQVSPALPSGAAAPAGSLFNTLLTPIVTVGGHAAEVLFSGLTPGFVGLNQLNIRVPLDAPEGFNVPLQITAGTVTTQVLLARVLPEPVK